MNRKLLFASRKPRKCPECGASPVASILFGMPIMTAKLEQQLLTGSVVLGGCCMVVPTPLWRCESCNSDIYHERDKLVMDQEQME